MKFMVKRIFDIFFSFLCLLILSPLILIISVFSYIIQGNPILFIHSRLGQNGKPFKIIKFRTMINKPSVSAKDDEGRLTIWGRFLRRTSLDEILALYNVVKGDMSIVGPRPMPVKYYTRFNNNQLKRFLIKPGITGLAQIKGRNKISWDERFKLDVDYVNCNSFFLDVKIIFTTFFIVLKGVGIKSKDSEIMPEFLGTEKKEK